MGVQFETLFEPGPGGDPLYLEIAGHAVEQALRIRKAFEAKGVPLHFNSVTNQQFPILTNEQNQRLLRDFSFELWERLEDGRLATRFCTSWATPHENVDALLAAIAAL